MSLTIKICKNTIILSNKAFSSLEETYLSFRDYPNLRHRCPFHFSIAVEYTRVGYYYLWMFAASTLAFCSDSKLSLILSPK